MRSQSEFKQKPERSSPFVNSNDKEMEKKNNIHKMMNICSMFRFYNQFCHTAHNDAAARVNDRLFGGSFGRSNDLFGWPRWLLFIKMLFQYMQLPVCSYNYF